MRAGTELAGRYRLDELLGHGGMGEVWAGFDQSLRRRVAVKVLLANLRDDERVADQVLARFRREGEAAARLNHRNITVVHDLGEHRETGSDGVERISPFLVQEFIDGRDLRSLLRDHPGGLPIGDVMEYGAQVCDGLAAAHTAGIVHRDIKPANLMLLADGTVKICDFGIARIQDLTADLTADGARPGTLAYMAPEQFDGQKADHRTDLYALGASLYQLCTGRVVFPADDLLALVGMHLTKAPDPPSIHRPAIPPALNALITSLLAKDPVQRPASASETASRLRATLTHTRPAEAEYTAPRSRPGLGSQAGVMGEAAQVAARHDPAQRRALLAEAERIARSLTEPVDQARASQEIAVGPGPGAPGSELQLAGSLFPTSSSPRWPPGPTKRMRLLFALLVAAGSSVFIAAYTHLPPFNDSTDSPNPTQTDPSPGTGSPQATCPTPQGGQEKVDSAVFSNPHIQMDSINYALSYRKDTGGSSWVYLTLFGRITGTVPQNSHLYILGSSDPKTWDSTGHWANGSYIWKKDHEVFPDAHGCWKLPEFGIAYSGAQGVTFRYYPSLLTPQALACITRLRTADMKDNEYDGHTEEQIDECGAARLGWVSVPTQRLPNAPSPSPRP